VSSEGEVLITLKGARLGYPGRTILDRVDLEVDRGDFLAIIGPNGSGKTTILRAMLGILEPSEGTVERRVRAAYAPQRRALDAIYPFTTREMVAMGLLGKAGVGRGGKKEAGDRVERALDSCGIRAIAGQHFRDLSGGQQQRAVIARALVSDPELLILDEPTNDLDMAGESGIMELVSELHRAGKTLVVVTHLLSVVANYATTVALIKDRRIDRAGKTDEVLTPENLAALYGVPIAVGKIDGRRAVVSNPRGAAP
jgi:ABC-type Mn2+/Zn2+ transport system ATPase subunit